MSDETAAVVNLIEAADLALLEHGITIVSYIDDEGERSMALKTHGDPWLGETLGLIELAKVALTQYEPDE